MKEEERDRFFEQTVATVWREERVSCPHKDILISYLKGALGKGAADYIRFHIEVVKCPWCTVELENLKLASNPEPMLEESMRRSAESALRSTILKLKAR